MKDMADQKVQFGKYKGKLVSWVVENDYNYAVWLMKRSSSTTKTKRAAQSFIDKIRIANEGVKSAKLSVSTEIIQ